MATQERGAWPEDVRQAIEWAHEAEVAAIEAKRAHEAAEAEAAVLGHLPTTEQPRVLRLRATAASRRAVDLLEAESDRRNRWAGFVIARALKRVDKGVWE